MVQQVVTVEHDGLMLRGAVSSHDLRAGKSAKDLLIGETQKLTTSTSNTDGVVGVPIDGKVYYTWILPADDDCVSHGTHHDICEPDILEAPKKSWRCIHCGRPNWLDRLTCEGCGAPEGEE